MNKAIMALLIAIVAAAAIAAGVTAQAHAKPLVSVYGPTELSCGAWTKVQTTTDIRRQYHMWMFGFVSGQIWASRHRDTVAMTDADAITAYVDKRCADHPLDSIVKVGSDLVDELVEKAKP